ncbi:hypothetical protein [Paenibacillus sp. KN14-4R]|uniref:hypothetical protein n=1 Tax=Paenibacillus sp. KN14-4R TaxID=3445773 RepID=UPI003F9FA8AD
MANKSSALPKWFLVITLIVLAVEIVSFFLIKNMYWRSGGQFATSVFCCAFGVKEWRGNRKIAIAFIALAVMSFFISLQTLWIGK